MTVGLAFHWFDRAKFLAEAKRVLAPGGWLVVYNDGFSGEMVGNAAYARWNRDQYLRKYPSPARNSSPLADNEVNRYSLSRMLQEQFTHHVELSAEQLVGYLLTQSNIIAAVENGSESVRDIADWLLRSVSPFFDGDRAQFPFYCRIDFLRRLATSEPSVRFIA
jgi:SAM-dependent methyltransferase